MQVLQIISQDDDIIGLVKEKASETIVHNELVKNVYFFIPILIECISFIDLI